MQNLNMLNAYNAKQHSFMNGEYTAVINKINLYRRAGLRNLAFHVFHLKRRHCDTERVGEKQKG